jgi:hypothetical protein
MRSVDGRIRLNVPEEAPEKFDPTFERDPRWRMPTVGQLAEQGWRTRAVLRPIRLIERNNLRLRDGTSMNYHDYLSGPGKIARKHAAE